MATRVIVLGEKEVPQGKKIELLQLLVNTDNGFQVQDDVTEAKEYNIIELICRNYVSGYDLMFCYPTDTERTLGHLFIGHFNDGVV